MPCTRHCYWSSHFIRFRWNGYRISGGISLKSGIINSISVILCMISHILRICWMKAALIDVNTLSSAFININLLLPIAFYLPFPSFCFFQLFFTSVIDAMLISLIFLFYCVFTCYFSLLFYTYRWGQNFHSVIWFDIKCIFRWNNVIYLV